jgi:hypothetical protein
VIAILLLALQAPLSHGVPSAERSALLEFFEATGGPKWKEKAGWGGPLGTECSWYGISCSPVDAMQAMHVTGISLPENHLFGSIPPTLADLPYLFALILQGNDIAGPLPEALLKRWDDGLLDLRYGTRYSTAKEIRLALRTTEYCANETLIIASDGAVTSFRERCRDSSGRRKTYCEVRHARTLEFDRLVRFLTVRGFWEKREPPALKGTWVDVPVTTITVKTASGNTSRQLGYDGDGSLDEWAIEKTIRGVVQTLEWGAPKILPKCPADDLFMRSKGGREPEGRP